MHGSVTSGDAVGKTAGCTPVCRSVELRSLAVAVSGHLRQHGVEVERSGLLPRRELDEPCQLLRDECLHHVYLRHMIDHLVRSRGLSREEAYILCSVAVDLKISEIVDAPNWIVSAFLPEMVFGGR